MTTEPSALAAYATDDVWPGSVLSLVMPIAAVQRKA
jgi:hypothetical protein